MRRAAEEFATLLERDRVPAEHPMAPLVTLARGLRPAEHAPSLEFRARLRERLLAEAATRPVTVPAPRRAADDRPHPALGGRLRHVVAAVTALALVTGTGAAAASQRALPGDLLYGLKRQLESGELALAFSDLGRGRELLEQADARLGEAEQLAAAGGAAEPASRQEIADLLAEWGSAAAAGAEALTESYRETGDAEPMQVLDRFVTDQQERLQDLLLLLDPSLRARVRAALDALESLGTTTGAVLASAREATTTVRESGDGWAVSALVDRAAESLAAGGTGTTPVALSGEGTAVGGADPVTVVTGQSGGGSGGDATSVVDVLDPVTDGATSTSTGTSTSTPLVSAAPIPTVSLEPLPTVTSSPLPTLTTGSLTPLPSVSVSACVPIPPLTSC